MSDEEYAQMVKTVQESLNRTETNRARFIQLTNKKRAIWMKMEGLHTAYVENWERLVEQNREEEAEDAQMLLSVEKDIQEQKDLLEDIEKKQARIEELEKLEKKLEEEREEKKNEAVGS